MDHSDESLNSSFYAGSEDDGGASAADADTDSLPSSSSKGRGSKSAPKPPLATCHKCNKKYYALEGYKKHMAMHIFEDLLLLAPTKEGFQEVSVNCSVEVLKEMQSKPVRGGKGPQVQHLINAILNPEPSREQAAQIFLNVVAQKLWECIPSGKVLSTGAFHSEFVSSFISMMSKDRDCIVQSVQNCMELPRPVLECYMCDFLHKVSIRFEAAFLSATRTPRFEQVYGDIAGPQRDNLEDPEIQQSIHYVGGQK